MGQGNEKLRDAALDYPILLEAPQVREGGVDGSFYRVTIEVPFRYESRG